jgi:hypothetical protein
VRERDALGGEARADERTYDEIWIDLPPPECGILIFGSPLFTDVTNTLT